MTRIFVGLLLAAAPGTAWASCDSMPYVLTNGTVANAEQVMADFDCLAQGTFGGGIQTKSGSIGINRNTSNGAIYDSSRHGWQFQQWGSTNSNNDDLVLYAYAPNGAFSAAAWSVDALGRMAVNSGTTNTSYTFYVNGYSGGNNGWGIASDERLKTNIRDVDHGVDTILQLRPVRFDWKTSKQRTVGAKMDLGPPVPQVGFLAQDVAKVLPEAVIKPETADQTYSFVPTDIIPFLVQAIKEQQAEIKSQGDRIKDLEGKLAAIK